MLITFKSPASHDVVMFEKNAQELLSILGKDPKASMGVVTVEQFPEAIVRLKAAIASEPENHASVAIDDDAEADSDEAVSIGQRALPFIELLELCRTEPEP
jgi:hypothetical protein